MVWGGRRPAPCRAPRAGSYPNFFKLLANGTAITYVGKTCLFVTPADVGDGASAMTRQQDYEVEKITVSRDFQHTKC